ncbi:MAG TPA: RES family NAD+ phosphorylase [Gaiellaceae bacterium]|nr:RES family NAD+ phosphorylase [Gaiellaceae bacterium]
MILFRCLAWDKAASPRARGGPLWFPRMLQGDGRHDNPILYGCLYASAEPVSAVAEQLDRLAGTFLEPTDLIRRGLLLALTAIAVDDEVAFLDLDDPAVLEREGLRPSRVATHDRSVTQAGAAELFTRHEDIAGIRWWSTFEALWANVTVFDRAEELLSVEDVHPLGLGDEVVVEAADYLGLPIST